MDTKKDNVTGMSDHGRVKRQAILDHLHKVGVSSRAQDLCLVVEGGLRSMGARLQRMWELRELARETRNVDGHLVHYFTPLVTVTMEKLPPTRWARAARQEARLNAGEDEFNDVPDGPWHTIHRCSNKKPPHPDQRGQCVTRPRCASVMASL